MRRIVWEGGTWLFLKRWGGLFKMVVYRSGIPAAAYPSEAAASAMKAGSYGVLARLIQEGFCYNRQSAALACEASVPVMFNGQC